LGRVSHLWFWFEFGKFPLLDWRKKIEKIVIFRGNFPNPNPNHRRLTRPGSKFFDPDPSLQLMDTHEVLLAQFKPSGWLIYHKQSQDLDDFILILVHKTFEIHTI